MTWYVLFDRDFLLPIGLSWRGERTSFLWTDFKLRRNALIGLYQRGGLLQWTQISNSEGMCWLDYIWEGTYFHGHRFQTQKECVDWNTSGRGRTSMATDFKLRRNVLIGLYERGRTSMATDFKLRRNALIGLYRRGGLLQWTQNSNSEGMCWLDYYERGRTSMATDFKLRRSVLIGLYERGPTSMATDFRFVCWIQLERELPTWPQNSNFQFVCWIQLERELPSWSQNSNFRLVCWIQLERELPCWPDF